MGINTMKFVEQEIAPKVDYEAGVDYGATGKILVRMNSKLLVWRGGHVYWSGVAQNQYAKANLGIVHEGMREYVGTYLHEGGRLSKKVISSCAESIDRYFVPGTAENIDLKKTMLLTEEDED